MATVSFSLVIREQRLPARRPGLTLDELAERSGCHVEVAERLFRFGLLEPMRSGFGHPVFDESQLFRLTRALRLKHDFGLNVDSVSLVIELLERIDRLEAQIRKR